MMKEDYKRHKRNYQFLNVIALFCFGIAIMLNLLANISFGETALFFSVAGCLIAIATLEYTRYLIKEAKQENKGG